MSSGIKISNLTFTDQVSGGGLIPIVQGNQTFSAPASAVAGINNLQNLQEVTDNGNTTTNGLSVASLSSFGKIIGGSEYNTATGQRAGVVGGDNNTAAGNFSFIGGGKSNTAYGNCSSILGGSLNTANHDNSFIIGSNLTSNAACTTFVNNLSAQCNIYAGSALTQTITAGNMQLTICGGLIYDATDITDILGIS